MSMRRGSIALSILTCIAMSAMLGAQAPSIRATGAPGSFQIVVVPVPAGLARSSSGGIEINARSAFTIVGVSKWSASALSGKTSITAILGIPAAALAGVARAADVEITTGSAPAVSMGIDVDVTVVHGFSMRMPTVPLRAFAGNRITLSYELTNTGNTAEHVETRVSVPSAWSAVQRGGNEVTLSAGHTLARQVEVAIPLLAGTGAFFLTVELLEAAVLRSSHPLSIEVLSGLAGRAPPGPEVTFAVARTADGQGHGTNATTTTIKGALYDSVRIEGRYTTGSAFTGASSQALSRLGSYSSAPSLVVSSPSGRLAMGAAGSSFSELTGLYAYGRGAALELRRSNWHVVALGALAVSTSDTAASQPVVGVRGDVDLGRLRVTSAVSHLRTGDWAGRQLDAAGAGAAVQLGFATTAQGEIALRRFAAGSGEGWTGELDRHTSSGSATVRMSHVPGGSDAFARAVDEFSGSISQQLGRLRMSAGAWSSSDSSPAFTQLRSAGWSVRPEFRLHSSTTIALEARAIEVAATTNTSALGTVGGYGSSEQQAGASINTTAGHLYLSALVTGGYMNREVVAADASVSAERSPKITWSGTGSWKSAGMTLDVQGRMEEMRSLSGAVLRPSQISIRGKHALGTSASGMSGDWEMQQIRGYSAAPTTVVRGGVSLPIINLFTAKLYAERNPLFRSAAEQSPWVFAMRMERAIHFPMARVPATTGYVYRDLNGNAKHDGDEPGLAGAVVTRGAETAMTDADGRYRLAGDVRSAIVLDESTLPVEAVRQTRVAPDIAVMDLLKADITFVATRPTQEAADVDLSAARIIARNAGGKEWTGRMTGRTTGTFDALPAGTYTIDLDLSSVTEQFVAQTPLALLYVTSILPSSATIYLDARPLRMWRAPTINPTTP